MARLGSPPLRRLILTFTLNLILIFTITTTTTSSSDPADALLSFKSTLRGADQLHGWLPNTPPCTGNHSNWDCVICVEGTVYGLQLENISLTGELVIDPLVGVRGLRTLSFMNNSLVGPIPDLGKLPALKTVYLSMNQFSGPIPDGFFKNLSMLKKVYLSQNKFTGPVPRSLAGLTRLLELRLDDNGFDGSLPDLRQPELKIVNVSYNNLEGPIPPRLSKMNEDMFEGNKNLCGPPLEVECDPTTHLPKKKFPIILVIIIILIVLGLIAAAVLIILRHRREQTHPTGTHSGDPKKLDASEADKLEQGSSSDIGVTTTSKKAAKEADHGRLIFVNENRERFELQDLLRASAEVLGSGNFGASYKAILLQGPSVVVKRFKDMNGVGREDFMEHMRRLGRLSHPNLLPLVAYYYRKEEKLLVTDFIYNGSLAHILHGNRGSNLPPLDWASRLKIVKGVARGLMYLYDELPMLNLPHGHLKSSNVLLSDSLEPLLSDYALTPVMNHSHASQVMVSYKSPEVTKTGKTSKKSDVWSFGILVLEILTGKFPATYLQRGKGSTDLCGWVNSVVKEEWTGEVFDGEMKGTKAEEAEMVKLLHIGMGCCEADVDKRWEMSQVLDKVEALGEGADQDYSSSSFASTHS